MDESKPLDVIARSVGPMFKNGFLVRVAAAPDAVLVDPGDEVIDLIAAARTARVTVRAILLTHAHFDHITGVGAAKQAFDVPIWLHRDDLFLYDGVVEQGTLFGIALDRQPPVDRFYSPDDRLLFGDLVIDVHHTPGHCPGGVCLAAGSTGTAVRELFVGDTLFAGSVGRSDLPGGDHEVLIDSIRRVLFAYPGDTVVHPGHGPDTTIGQERSTNPFLS